RVLQSLLREGVSIRDLGVVVEAIGDKARLTRDPALLAEYARQALGRQITTPFIGADRKLRAITLDPVVEQEVAEAITATSLEEVLPQIKADLGPDAEIVRQREGLTGGVGGFFQRACVEVEARPPGEPGPPLRRFDAYDDEPAMPEPLPEPFAEPFAEPYAEP